MQKQFGHSARKLLTFSVSGDVIERYVRRI